MALYDAFISYSHAKDKPIAAALQSAIQKLGKPWYRRRALRVFRDDTSLSATPHLWPTIQQALSESRYLIVLASPEAATSPLVGKEIAYWLEAKSVDTLLIAVTDGAITWENAAKDFTWFEGTPLPPVLKGRFDAEPKWVDLTAYREGADKRDAKFTELAADFAATIRGMPKEDLLSQEVKQQRRALGLAWSAAGSLLILLVAATVATFLAYRAQQEAVAQRNRAEQTLTAATKTANGLVFDLADRFQNTVGVPAALIKDILDRAINLQQQLIGSGRITPALEASEGSASIQSAQALLKIGDTVDALKSADRARQIHERLLTANPSNIDWQDGLAVSQYWIGQVLRAEGKNSEALEAYRASLAITQKLADNAPANPTWQYKLASDYEKIGDTLAALFRWDEALLSYKTNLAIRQRLSDIDQNNSDWQFALAVAYGRFGDLFLKQNSTRVNTLPADGDRIAAALDAAQKGIAILKRLADGAPENALWTKELGIDYDLLGDLLRVQGNIAEALEAYQKGLVVRQRLADSDSTNLDWQNGLAFSSERIGRALAAQGKNSDALDAFNKSIAVWQKLAEKDPSNTGYADSATLVFEKIGYVMLAQGKNDDALAAFRNMLAGFQKLADANRTNAIFRRELSISWEHIGDVFLLRIGKGADALDAYHEALTIRQTALNEEQSAERQHDLAIIENKVGNALRSLGRNEEALDAYQAFKATQQRLSDQEPDNLQTKSNLLNAFDKVGNTFLALGKIEDALDNFQTERAIVQPIVDANPTNGFWQSSLARAYEMIGNASWAGEKLKEAIAAYQSSLTISEANAGSRTGADTRRILSTMHRKIGDVLMQQGNDADALIEFQQMLAIAQKYPDPASQRWQLDTAAAYEKVGSALLALGKLDDALESYRQDLAIMRRLFDSNLNDGDLRSELADSFYRVGKALETKSDFQGAIENYDETIRLAPTAATTWTARCWAHAMLDQLHEALADCNESIRLQPNVAGSFGTRAFVYLKLTQYDEAIADYTAGLAISPQVAGWLYGRRLARQEKGDLSEGKADIATAKAIDPDIATKFVRYGVALVRTD
jgi:tetratricopeptide (TPR) repeat protein